MPTVNSIPGTNKYVAPASVVDEEEPGLHVSESDLLYLLDALVETANSLNLTLPGSEMGDKTLGNNRWLLGTGTHAGKTMDGGGVGAIVGSGPGAVIDRYVVCAAGTTTIISGVEFAGAVFDKGMLQVGAAASVIVNNCVFASSETSTTSPITVAATGRLLINNCIFTGMSTTTNQVIGHAGAPGNVQVAFCHNLTGNSLFTPAVAQVGNVAITAVGVVGNVHNVVIDGVTGSHIVIGGDTTSTVVDGLIAALSAAYPPAGPLGEWPVTLTDAGASFSVTAKVAGTAFTLVYSSTGSAAATVTTPQANVVAGAIGTGNL